MQGKHQAVRGWNGGREKAFEGKEGWNGVDHAQEGDRIGRAGLRHILTTIPGQPALAGTDPRSPIEQAEALFGVRGRICPLSQGDLQPAPN